MEYSELENRLLKIAAFNNSGAIKNAAGELLSLVGDNVDNVGLGNTLINHIQNISQYDPGTTQFARYLKENNIDESSGRFLHSLADQFTSLARSPDTFSAIGDSLDPSDLETLLKSEQGARLEKSLMEAFNPAKVTDLQAQAARARMAMATPRGVQYQANLASRGKPGVLDNARTAAELFQNRDEYSRQVKMQLLQGVGKGLNIDSPLARRMMAQGATGYLENQINKFAPRTSVGGQAFNSLGKFMLGLVGMMPGYESIINWLAKRDFMFGKQLKALPKQTQDYARSQLPKLNKPEALAAKPNQPFAPSAASAAPKPLPELPTTQHARLPSTSPNKPAM
jgi:hypothetical protein